MYRILFFLVLLSPLVNVIADTTINYFDREQSSFHFGLVRGVYLLALIIWFHVKYGFVKEQISIIIVVFLTYLFLILPLSSDYMYSLNSGYLKWFGSLLLFPLGLFFFRTHEQLAQLARITLWSSLPIILVFIHAQIFKVGGSAYIEDSFFFGGANIGITNTLTYILLFSPAYFILAKRKVKSEKIIMVVLIILSAFIIVMVMKRSAIFGLALGYAIYLTFSKRKLKQLKFISIVAIITVLTSTFYLETLSVRFEARTTERNRIENEARYLEVFYVLKEFDEGSISHKLLGSEPFNTGKYFGPKYFNKNRMIHGDLSSFLYGTGLIGLVLFLSITYYIFKFALRRSLSFRHFFVERELTAVLLGVLTSGFFISLTGSGTIGSKGLYYLIMGSIIGVLRNSYYESQINKQKQHI